MNIKKLLAKQSVEFLSLHEVLIRMTKFEEVTYVDAAKVLYSLISASEAPPDWYQYDAWYGLIHDDVRRGRLDQMKISLGGVSSGSTGFKKADIIHFLSNHEIFIEGVDCDSEEIKGDKQSPDEKLACAFVRIERVLKSSLDRIAELESQNKFQEQTAKVLDDRSETTYQNIIGGLLGLMLGKTPAGKPQSVFDDQAAIISALLAHNESAPGISKRNLEKKFAESKRSLAAP